LRAFWEAASDSNLVLDRLVRAAAEALRATCILALPDPASQPPRPGSSELRVPVRAGDRCLGTLRLARSGADARDARPFTDEEVELATQMAGGAALAIVNGQVFSRGQEDLAELRRMGDRMRLLSELSQEFAAATGDYRVLLDLVARRMGEVVGEAAAIRMITDDGQSFEALGSVFDPDPARLAYLLATMQAEPQRIGQGITGRVVASGQSVLIPAFTEAHLGAIEGRFRELLTHLDLTSVIAVPLRAHGRVVGAAVMYRTSRGRPYTEDDLRLLEDLMRHAALAIANSRLLRATELELGERRKTEEALRRTEEELRQAQKMEAVGRLAGGVAHDFNNLLSVILSTCALLLEDLAPGARMRGDIDEIRQAGERAADLTRQLLAFSRRQVIEPRILRLDEVVAGMESMIRRVLGEDVVLRIVRGRDVGRIKADRGHLEQVILNLIVNARDAMPGGGTVIVETASVELDGAYAERHIGIAPGPHAMLAVSDTGVGIDRPTLQRIFEPFFTTKQAGKGTGLGLSTVFGIVRQSGGGIWAYSEVGRGSTFKVYLPRTDEPEGIAAAAATPPETLRGSETILLAEDQEQVRTVARAILERHGYQVLEARDGSEALGLGEGHPATIDLLVTDVVMPGMTGRELAERLRPLRPGMRVLYVSGYTEETILHQRVVAPGVAFLQKPLVPRTLLAKIREVLDAGAHQSVPLPLHP
jgi:signal transduction histidine kinase/ActR/RegA family two-component response regulator